jgi:16S rRNA processing protein RimM
VGQEGFLTSSSGGMVVVGKVGAPHGVKGWVHVHSFTVPTDNILNYEHWHLSVRENWKSIQLLEIRPQGNHFVALFQGYEDRDKAASLTNAQIGVKREQLPVLEKGGYYWADLIGLTVITETGETLGVIEQLFETGSNDVIVVKGEAREHLIPYIPEDYILDINLDSRVMRVSWDPEF